MAGRSRVRSIRYASSLFAFLAAVPASGLVHNVHHRALLIRPRHFMGRAASELYAVTDVSEKPPSQSLKPAPSKRKTATKASLTTRKTVKPHPASGAKVAKANSKAKTGIASKVLAPTTTAAAASDRSAAAWSSMLDRYKQSKSKRSSNGGHEAAPELHAWVDRQRSAAIKGKDTCAIKF